MDQDKDQYIWSLTIFEFDCFVLDRTLIKPPFIAFHIKMQQTCIETIYPIEINDVSHFLVASLNKPVVAIKWFAVSGKSIWKTEYTSKQAQTKTGLTPSAYLIWLWDLSHLEVL